MSTFNTQKYLNGDPSLIPTIASKIESAFVAEGYTVQNQSLLSGASDISITKGGIFKAVLGMKTALKITLKPQGNGIYFDAGVGIFGQQVIPTLIMWFLYWPVILTQIWGLIKQSQLDDKALQIAEEAITNNSYSSFVVPQARKTCAGCGRVIPEDASFCPGCGRRQ